MKARDGRRGFGPLGAHSLLGQMLLAVAGAVLLIQGLGALLIYRAQAERREADMIHAAAFRLIAALRGGVERPPGVALPDPPAMAGKPGPAAPPDHRFVIRHSPAPMLSAGPTIAPAEPRDADAERELRGILADQGVAVSQVLVTTRMVRDDPPSLALARGTVRQPTPGRSDADRQDRDRLDDAEVMVVGAHFTQGPWLTVRVFIRPVARAIIVPLVWQTLLIYAVVVGVIALILRRITRPLAALTRRLEDFARTRSTAGQLAPEGPGDVRNLIVAHNAMEARIAALLGEKDLMLGAIGHDLKTPLAALRVRIESVADEVERARMAATIEDIVRTLDDILSLARVGRPTDPRERNELSALVSSVVDEFEDIGAPIALGETVRVVANVRATWLRRALRNLVGNALRYGHVARVSLAREGDIALIRIEDDGPGIAPADIARMTDPFTRGEPSRNSATGGAGLGLALANAIADQHGGALTLENRRAPDGEIGGLIATLRLPV